MYAIVETGGKQYRVQEGDVLRVERLPGNVGDTVTLDKVLLLCQGKKIQVGTPWVSRVKVTAQIVAQGRGKKIIVFKHKRRKNYRRTRGHRQALTTLRIASIEA